MSRKELGNAVKAILATVLEKYCSGCDTETEVRDLVKLLNAAEDMATFYGLKEINFVEYQAVLINSMLVDDNKAYQILKEGGEYKLVIIC